ncbi:ferritin-like domain-containing protein [Pelagibacterium halotolerans]|uniref:Uncharacterized protein n=1 Tax=Pelagibacterium halotolerans (strain DSM 22347 / JCM 15775 / CGMCC 1.7692 / B2) TaxID=1082931 RepID=G4R6D9_PELHB|nr:DUF892 family protein [Pelagibacterium halotolerans]AEQ53204.1 hypothetical protein KKY_3215 [Pelagibacterium halotolerans B2]QJR17158.1 DUF892 family protein [Pelagibacterium halotolerans]SEA90009.1 Ferritin-like metal-binding protein YciE [Pelagibacterium halotolerans]
MSISSLQDLFIHTLQDVYFAENLIVRKLPTMVKEAGAAPLKKAFEEHLEETRTHVSRLDAVFKILGEKPEAEECPAIEGIIEEAEELIGEISNAKTKDAALIAAGQAVEHYEITRYGTLVSWAKELGHEEVLAHLRETLAEEKDADNKLMRLGEDQLNQKAA